MRSLDILAGTDRPVGGDPFAGGVREQGGKVDLSRGLLDPGGLDGCYLLLAQRLADDVQATCERSVAERDRPPLERRADDGNEGLFGLASSAWARASAAAIVPMRSLD
jgi:hypothetical protein